MGCSNIYCLICGMTFHSLPSDYYSIQDINKITEESIIDLSKNTQYFDKCTILTIDNKIIHDCEDTNCAGTFMNIKDKKEYVIYGNYFDTNVIDKQWYDIINFGVFLHTDCWNYVKINYNIELKFIDLPIIDINDVSKKLKKYKHTYLPPNLYMIDYGLVQKYWGQNFDYIKLLEDENEWMCINPLKNNSKNTLRIKKIISQLKLKTNNKRPSPNISAIFYEDNLYKIGNNKKIWITKNNKWKEIKKSVIIKDYRMKNSNKKEFIKIIEYINKFKHIGQYSNIQVFIYDLEKISNNEYSFKLLSI